MVTCERNGNLAVGAEATDWAGEQGSRGVFFIYTWCGNGGFAADDGDDGGMTVLPMVRMMVEMLAVLMMTAGWM